jgi:hypothetical protein
MNDRPVFSNSIAAVRASSLIETIGDMRISSSDLLKRGFVMSFSPG